MVSGFLLASMKKKRGLRKYYKNLEKSFNPEKLNWKGENAWFDLFHFHIDKLGLGNRSWKSRKQHLDTLFSIAEKVEEKLKDFELIFQYWIEIYDHNSYDDAVYIHSENPNESNFPSLLTFDKDVVVKNKNLKQYLENKDYILRTKNLLEGNKPVVGYFLQKKDFGLKLENISD